MKNRNKSYRLLSIVMLLVMTVMMVFGCGQNQVDEKDTATVENQKKEDSGSEKPNEEDENVAMGRYTEEEIDLSQNVSTMGGLSRLSDGSLLLSSPTEGLWVSKDKGVTWEPKDVPYFNELIEKEFYIRDIKMSSDGTVGIIYDNQPGEDYTPICELVKPDGEVIMVELPLTEEDVYPRNIWITESGRYFVTTLGNNIYEIKEDGTGELFLTVDGRPELLQFQDNIMFMDGHGYREILLYDMEKKEYIKDDVLAEFVQNNYGDRDFSGSSWYDLYIFSGEDHVIYLAGDQGLYRHVIGGSAVEQLIDGNLSRLGNPAYGLAGMISLENAEFLAAFNGGKLIHFVYDPDIPSVPSERLKIYSLEESSVLRQAISSYQVENPEVYIEYEVGMEEGSSITKDDALKTLNTKIMTGEGPDVLMMDGLSIDSYVKKGVLLSLNELIEDITKEEELYENMIDALRIDGNAYVIPGQVWFPVILGREKYVSQMTDLKGTADAIEQMRADIPEKDLLEIISEKGIMKVFALCSAPAWKTENGEIDKEAIKEFLTQTKRIYKAQMDGLDELYIERYNQRSQYFVSEEGENWMCKLRFYIPDSLSYVSGLTELSLGTNFYPYGYCDLTSAAKTKGFEDTMLKPMEGQSSHIYLPQNMMGINAASSRIERAEDFLKLFLSKEVQKSIGYYTINKEALDEMFVPEWELGPNGEYGGVSMSTAEGLEASMTFYFPTEEELATFRGWMETADTPYIEDSLLEETVFQEGSAFILGDQSLDEAVNAIEQKLAIYLAE